MRTLFIAYLHTPLIHSAFNAPPISCLWGKANYFSLSLSLLPLSTVCKTDRALIKSKRDFQNNNVTLRLTFRWSFSNLNRVKFRLASNPQNISLVIDSVLEEERLFSSAVWHELLFLLASVASSQTEKLFYKRFLSINVSTIFLRPLMLAEIMGVTFSKQSACEQNKKHFLKTGYIKVTLFYSPFNH